MAYLIRKIAKQMAEDEEVDISFVANEWMSYWTKSVEGFAIREPEDGDDHIFDLSQVDFDA